jgi:hypothetical protein
MANNPWPGVSQDKSKEKAKPSPLATTVAAISAFFGMPLLARLIEPLVSRFGADNYGSWILGLTEPLAWAFSAALIFFGVRALTPTVLELAKVKGWLTLIR